MSDEALAVGARVCYWPGWREGDPRRGVLDSERTLLGGHTWGYYVRKDGGGSDFIAETHIEADDATPPLVAAPPVPPVVPDSEALEVPVRVFNRRPDGRPKGYEATKEAIAAQGWTWFVLSDFDDRVDFLWVCPGCGGGAAGTLGDEPRGGWDEPRWVMDGAPGRPTLTPSLGCPRWREGTCDGHWWLRDGRLVRA